MFMTPSCPPPTLLLTDLAVLTRLQFSFTFQGVFGLCIFLAGLFIRIVFLPLSFWIFCHKDFCLLACFLRLSKDNLESDYSSVWSFYSLLRVVHGIDRHLSLQRPGLKSPCGPDMWQSVLGQAGGSMNSWVGAPGAGYADSWGKGPQVHRP
jgi:hypothetical protein